MDAAPAAVITILYFAWLRERIGVSEETMPLSADVRTVADLTGWLRGRTPQHEAAFAHARVIRCAVNGEFADDLAPVRAGDEVAFFPPVTGG